jgi:predicted RNase H-like HicB family nuclease
MLTDYIRAAMRRATYELMEDDEGFWGEIPGFQGVWANADTLEACRDELQEVLEDWILFGVWLHHELPEIDGLSINLRLDEADREGAREDVKESA